MITSRETKSTAFRSFRFCLRFKTSRSSVYHFSHSLATFAAAFVSSKLHLPDPASWRPIRKQVGAHRMQPADYGRVRARASSINAWHAPAQPLFCAGCCIPHALARSAFSDNLQIRKPSSQQWHGPCTHRPRRSRQDGVRWRAAVPAAEPLGAADDQRSAGAADPEQVDHRGHCPTGEIGFRIF